MKKGASPSTDGGERPEKKPRRIARKGAKSEPRLDLDIERLLMASNDVRMLTMRTMDKYVRSNNLSERALDIISLIDLGFDRPSKLNKYFGVFPSAITLETDKLAEAGYITRTPDQKDRRVILLALTERGRRVREDSIALVNNAFRDRLSDVTADELGSCVEVLRKIVGPLHPPTRPDNS